MTTTNKVLIFGSIGAGLLYVAAKARTIGNLIFMPGSVVGMAFNNLSPVITLSIIVQNTSGFSVRVDSFAGNLISDGTYIGNVYNFNPVLIPANSQTVFSVDARLQPIGIVDKLISAWQTKNWTQNVKIEGFVNAGVLQIPITINFSIGG